MYSEKHHLSISNLQVIYLNQQTSVFVPSHSTLFTWCRIIYLSSNSADIRGYRKTCYFRCIL